MSLILRIVPFNDGIDMFGEPDASYVLYYVSIAVSIDITTAGRPILYQVMYQSQWPHRIPSSSLANPSVSSSSLLC